MNDYESLRKQYRESFPGWSDKDVNDHALKMSKKYSTIKQGPNVVHLDYYHGLIQDDEIIEIENELSTAGLELSRFDKNGVMYASLQDFTLQIALIISHPVVQKLLSDTTNEVTWKAIKAVTLYAWRKIKMRMGSTLSSPNSKKLNFGMKLSKGNNMSMDFKLDGEFTEELVLKALDKVLVAMNKDAENTMSFNRFDQETESWKEVNIHEELRKERENAQEKQNIDQQPQD